MKLFSSKKRIGAIGAIAALTLVGGGVAYGYWTTTGTGTGTAAAAGGNIVITVTGTTSGTLAPGLSVPVSFTVNNPAAYAQRLTKITLTGITTDAAHSSCGLVVGTDFTMPDVNVNADVAAGASALTPQGTLTMVNRPTPQDACKGAPLALTFATS